MCTPLNPFIASSDFFFNGFYFAKSQHNDSFLSMEAKVEKNKKSSGLRWHLNQGMKHELGPEAKNNPVKKIKVAQ